MGAPRRAPPLLVGVARALATSCEVVGREDLAAIIVDTFRAMLRTAEAVSLTLGQARISSDLCSAIIALPATKAPRGKNSMEAVVLTRRLAVSHLAAVYAPLQPGDRLLRGRPASFHDIFRHGVQSYSLRRGSMTHEMRTRGSIACR